MPLSPESEENESLSTASTADPSEAAPQDSGAAMMETTCPPSYADNNNSNSNSRESSSTSLRDNTTLKNQSEHLSSSSSNSTRKKVVIALDSKEFSDEEAQQNDVETGLGGFSHFSSTKKTQYKFGQGLRATRWKQQQPDLLLTAISEGGDDEQSKVSSSAIGSLVASIAPSFSTLKNRTTLFAILVFVLGCCAAAAFMAVGITGAKREEEDHFRDHSNVVVSRIQAVFAKYEVAGLHVHHACRNGITRKEFRELYEALVATDIAFQVTSYNPNTTHAERHALQEESRHFYARHYPEIDYQGIRGLEPKPDGSPGLSVQNRSEQPFYFPVHYLEPVESNIGAIDFDLYSSSSRRQTINQVLSTWKPALTPRLSLVQESVEGSFGVILFHPGVPLSTEPNLTTNSFSSMVVRIPDLITAATQHLDRSKVYIYDATDISKDADEEPAFLGGASIGSVPLQFEAEIGYGDLMGSVSKNRKMEVTTIDVASRQWDIVVIAVNGSYEPNLTFVIVGGTIIFAAGIFLALWLYANGNREIKLNQIRSVAESEKAALILDSMAKTAKAERDLNDFIAHEVRNPLSAAMSACTFVKSETVAIETTDESRKDGILEDIEIVQSSLEHMNELLRNMLDMQRAASNQLRMELGPTDLYHDVLKPVDAMIYRRGANFEVICDCNPQELCVESDRLRLKQIVLNLARNSVKFVEKGFVRIRAAVVNGLVHLYVEDSGPGIPMAKQEQLFAKFQESLDSLNQGTGIGLSLCKDLANLLGADLWYDPNYNSGVEGCPGARFVLNLMKPPVTLTDTQIDTMVTQIDDLEGNSQSFTLPTVVGDGSDNESRAQSEEEKTEPVSDRPAAAVVPDSGSTEKKEEELPNDLSVLFVDDALVLRKLFARSMKRVAPNWKLGEAANGESALQMIDEGSTFDVIFMDQYMASVEKQLLGTETVRALRSKGVKSFICGLSANDLQESFVESGADAFLMKPLPCDPTELKRELNRLLRNFQQQEK